MLVLSTTWKPDGAGICKSPARSRRTPKISSAAAAVNVKVTVTFPESRKGAGGDGPNLDLKMSCGPPAFSLSCQYRNMYHKKAIVAFEKYRSFIDW